MVNVDASFDPVSSAGSTEVIIRDWEGDFVAATNTFIPNVAEPHMAEVYALKEGLLLAQQVGASKVIVQSDCLMVVETMGNGGFSATSAAAIYDESYSLWREFGDISIESTVKGMQIE